MSDQQPVNVTVHNHMPAQQTQPPQTIIVQNARSIVQDIRDLAIIGAIGLSAFDMSQGDKSMIRQTFGTKADNHEIKVDARPRLPQQKSTISFDDAMKMMDKRDSLLSSAKENKADTLSITPVEVAPEAPAVSVDSAHNVAHIQTIKMKI